MVTRGTHGYWVVLWLVGSVMVTRANKVTWVVLWLLGLWLLGEQRVTSTHNKDTTESNSLLTD